jgi:hypothetical protein
MNTSDEDTKNTFDLTGELKKLNESGAFGIYALFDPSYVLWLIRCPEDIHGNQIEGYLRLGL